MKISFKNYKSFWKKSEIDLKKFNIILGPNSSGKSSLSELISYYVDLTTKNTLFFSDSYSIKRGLTNIKSLKGAKTRLHPHAVFPKYYRMSNAQDFTDTYNGTLKYLFAFKDYKRWNQATPDKIHMFYPVSCIVRPQHRLGRDDRLTAFVRSPLLNESPLFERNMFSHLDIPFGNQNIVSMIDKHILHMDSFLASLQNHPEKPEGRTKHEIDVQFGRLFTQYKIQSKEPFLNGLTLIKDRDSSESFLYHEDGSEMFKQINKVIDNLTLDIFKPQLEMLEEKFSDYKESLYKRFPKEKKHDFHLTIPLPIDKSTWNTSSTEHIMNHLGVGDLSNNAVVNVIEKTKNLWNVSPYLNSYHYHNYDNTRRISNIGRFRKNPLNEFLPKHSTKPVIRNVNPRFMDPGNVSNIDIERSSSTYRKDPVNFFEWKDGPSFQSKRFREDPFTDFDFYKDFCLKKQELKPKTILKKLNGDFKSKSRNRAIQPAYGVLFSLEDPTLRKAKAKAEFETFNIVRRDVVSDTEDIISFLKEVGAKKILDDFELVKRQEDSGRIETWRFKGHLDGRYYDSEEIDQLGRNKNQNNGLINLSLYAHHFRQAINSSSLSCKIDIKESDIKDTAKKYEVSRAAIINQIDIIRMYLHRLSIVQFQKNAYKYLYHDYIARFHNFVHLDFQHDRVILGTGSRGVRSMPANNRVFIIKPNTGDIFSKKTTKVTKEDLINFFGETNRDMFEEIAVENSYRTINRSIKIKNFINKCLGSEYLNLGFQIDLENLIYSNNNGESENYYFGIRHQNRSKSKKKTYGELVSITDVGMGNASIISILGSLYRFNKVTPKSAYTIILREPETYLHPAWIEKLIKFLYEFFVGNNDRNLKLVIETHSESVLRTAQLIMKNKPSSFKDTIGIYYLNDKGRGKGTEILDLGLEENGFLSEKIPPGFFEVNTQLIAGLWDDDE